MQPAGASAGAFKIIVQPDASAAATLRTAWLSGKFQGVMARQTPIGSRTTSCCTRGLRDGMMRP